MSDKWTRTSCTAIMNSESVLVSGLPGHTLGEFLPVIPKRLKIVKGDPDLSDELNDLFVGLTVVSFLGQNEMKSLPADNRVVLFKDIVAELDEERAEKAIGLLERIDLGPDDSLNLSPEQFTLS